MKKTKIAPWALRNRRVRGLVRRGLMSRRVRGLAWAAAKRGIRR